MKRRIHLKKDKYLRTPSGKKLFNSLLQNAGNWVKISKKNCKFVRGVLIEIDTIHRKVMLHAERPIIVKFKEIRRIQYISVSCHLPKFYKNRLRKLGVHFKPKKVVEKRGQMKFDGGKKWPKNKINLKRK